MERAAVVGAAFQLTIPTLYLAAWVLPWPGGAWWRSNVRRVRWVALVTALYFVAVMAMYVALRQWDQVFITGYCAAVYGWVWWRAGGDDSTRRLRRRLTSAVRAVGARLSVVPAPA